MLAVPLQFLLLFIFFSFSELLHIKSCVQLTILKATF